MDMGNMIQTGYAAGAGFDGSQRPSMSDREKTGGSFSDTMLDKFSIFAGTISPRDISQRDISPKDISPRDISQRDISPGDISLRDISLRDISPKDMTLTEYKMYIDDKIKSLHTHPSQRYVSWFIDITDAAYRRMQADPLYEQQVLDYLARNKAVNAYGHAPRFVYIHIDDTWDKTYGYAFGMQDDCRARRAAERRRMAEEAAKKARRKKLLKEYLKKRAEAKRLQDKLLENRLMKHRLEHERLTRKWKERKQTAQAIEEKEAEETRVRNREVREWSEERQAEAARNAYEASIVMMIRQEEQLFN